MDLWGKYYYLILKAYYLIFNLLFDTQGTVYKNWGYLLYFESHSLRNM